MNLQWYKDYPTSDKKLTGVEVAISVVVTFIFINIAKGTTDPGVDCFDQ